MTNLDHAADPATFKSGFVSSGSSVAVLIVSPSSGVGAAHTHQDPTRASWRNCGEKQMLKRQADMCDAGYPRDVITIGGGELSGFLPPV